MKPLLPFLMLCLVAASRICLAQADGGGRVAHAGQQVNPVDPDKVLQAGADSSLKKLESALGGYLVAFDTRLESDRRRLGIPLATFADNAVSVAYDVNGKGAMAQWKSSESAGRGTKMGYQAFMGEAGALSFVLSARF